MSSTVKSQNLSIMMTDIQGYSTTAAHSSREEIVTLIRRHNQLMVPVIEFYGGKIVKSIGDAFLCTFVSATDAVICSIIIQLLLREYNARQKNESLKLNLRVVVHSGDVSIEGNDIFGDAVNVTARMETLPCFPGGSIGISEITYLLMDKNEITVENLGLQELKGLPHPVNVYRIPLEKQKLTTLPTHLLELVEQVIAGKAGTSAGGTAAEWKKSIVGFLKEKNWGDNLGNIKENLGQNLGKVQKQLGQNIGQVQRQLVQTFGQKTVLEQNKGKALSDASLTTRMKCFVIDLLVIGLLAFLFKFGWWPVQRIVFGAVSITSQEYYKLPAAERSNYEDLTRSDGTYYRNKGWIEWLTDLNIHLPIIPVILYFGIFWYFKGASPGQIAGRSAVVTTEGHPLPIDLALKRAVLFVFLVLPAGIGGLAIFIGDRQTIWDKLCSTRVVE
ncbi:MAG TPA: adenylate/guanylate cyclase domain-containing protein [Candidatus Ozemobacteraceae bacterium]|nr:adenylate/guanylate cyclase domain-containing protein [Candidatus Ozemobacteraceae bacterium]